MIQLLQLLLCTIPLVVGEVLPLQLDLDNSQV